MTDPRFHPNDPNGVFHDSLMFQAWADLMMWVTGQKDIIDRFIAETGFQPPLRPRSAIEALVDDACGVTELQAIFMGELAHWATRELWGRVTPSIQRALDKLPRRQ